MRTFTLWTLLGIGLLLSGPSLPGAENTGHPKEHLLIMQVYPVKDLATSSRDRSQFDPSGLIAHITTSIDPKTWTVDVDPFRHEGFVIAPQSMIATDDVHLALVITTTVKNHRAIKSYLRELRTARPLCVGASQ